MPLRELIKRRTPGFARALYTRARTAFSAPPLEATALHGYRVIREAGIAPRLTLVLPTIAREKLFGGVSTGLDIFLALGRRTGADLRVIVDDFDPRPDRTALDAKAVAHGIDSCRIDLIPRDSVEPAVSVRRSDVFMTYNWWTSLNVASLIEAHSRTCGGIEPSPFLYLIQEYEPAFYPFSSTHMFARQAFDSASPYWGIFNSRLLSEYFLQQGHRAEKTFVFEPRLDSALMPFLDGEPPSKERIILVYGRSTIPRNCFPAVVAGLRRWVAESPASAGWSIVSAGLPHPPISLGGGRQLRSLGKLDLSSYARLLRRSAVGLSLMASPHPSYPPLEMAHFGLFTITNRYAKKDLAAAHDCIISVDDVSSATLSAALSSACERFEAAPDSGWQASSHIASYLRQEPFEFVEALAEDLAARVWRTQGQCAPPSLRG